MRGKIVERKERIARVAIVLAKEFGEVYADRLGIDQLADKRVKKFWCHLHPAEHRIDRATVRSDNDGFGATELRTEREPARPRNRVCAVNENESFAQELRALRPVENALELLSMFERERSAMRPFSDQRCSE